jgi:hypothetical protein
MNPTTTPTPIFPVCSSCGEHRGLDHDPARCWTIAHAFAAVAGKNHFPGLRSDDPDYNIVELSRWLRDRPKQRGTQQYRDRETSLDRWITKAQLIAGGRQ